ncbi:hypothetical protein HH214_03115 [Mucilaginibacter robiniae]|uniref:Integral membrane protein n=1 Tax=Mucilaginibacter robiniae TaxID=2728022 RepID=A0A7L5DV16_9SPHI|nr:DUF6010 family protein [Mucilaginibacter robiniae]QJD94940.1 hypothetical protein HH214_03115 [Mucilaginibacter robiniae]
MAIVVALVAITLLSLFREPERQKFNALLIAGASATYLSGGLGVWEFTFCATMTALAYFGFRHYYFIGTGWLLHVGWDVMHHLYGSPIIPFLPTSSAGCAVCDSLLALWFFCKAPSVFTWFRK